MNTVFICHYAKPDPVVSVAEKLLESNSWYSVRSNHLPESQIPSVCSGSTWLLYFYDLSKDSILAPLELGIGLASNEVNLIALIGLTKPHHPYLCHPKVQTFPDIDNFIYRQFVP